MSNETNADEPSGASAGCRGSNGLAAYYVHGTEYDTGCEFEFVTLFREHAEASGGTVQTLVQITDAEREAIWTVAEAYAENDGDPECERIASIMQGLWHRTK